MYVSNTNNFNSTINLKSLGFIRINYIRSRLFFRIFTSPLSFGPTYRIYRFEIQFHEFRFECTSRFAAPRRILALTQNIDRSEISSTGNRR